MRLLITGGGTGGHTSPAVAIIEELRSRDPRLEVQWVGRRHGIEERIARSFSIPFRAVPMRGWPRRNPLKKAVAAGRLAYSIALAYLLIRKFRPHAVVGVGGYVSLPVCWTAPRLGIPTFIHEQNRQMGLANRMAAVRATRILLSFPDTKGAFDHERAVVVGNPVRSGFFDAPSQSDARERLGLAPSIPVVLVTGGSQGAETLNRATAEALEQFQPGELQLIWMAGAGRGAKARDAAANAKVTVQVSEFIEDMVTACAAADLIVSRAGASMTAEIAALGKPSILVPYPYATDDHQTENARAFDEAGAATVLADRDCSGDRLVEHVRSLIGAPDRLEAMGREASRFANPVAAEAIVSEILANVFEPENSKATTT